MTARAIALPVIVPAPASTAPALCGAAKMLG